MIDIILTYLLIGTIWSFTCERLIVKMEDNGTRIRFILFWPYTFSTFVIALIKNFMDNE